MDVVTYSFQIWTFTKENVDRIAKTQKTMENQILGIPSLIRLIEKNKKIRIIKKNKSKRRLKWKSAGYTLGQKYDRWNEGILYPENRNSRP